MRQLTLVATALLLIAGSGTCLGQTYVAGYVDVPSNYATDQAARDAFENALSGKVQWKAFPTEEALASAMSEGDVQVGIGQTINGWLEGIKSGQSITAVGVSRSEDVPCLISADALSGLKSNDKDRYKLQLGGTWAKDNVAKQLQLAGIDQSSVEYVFGDFDPMSVDADISCVSGQTDNSKYQPMLTGLQAAQLSAETTALITMAPGFDTDVVAKDFLFADDAAKSVAKSMWTLDKSRAIVLPSINDQNTDLVNSDILGLVKSWANPEDVSVAEPYVASGPLMDLGSGVRGVKLLFGTDRAMPERGQGGVMPTAARAETLSFGSVLVSIPVDHKRGRVERPFEVPVVGWRFGAEDPLLHFTIQSIAPLSETDFLGEVSSLSGKGTDYAGHALVFVHGYNSPFEDAAFRLAQIVYDMNFDGLPILYSWPSKGTEIDYVADYNASENAAFYFAEFLHKVATTQGVSQVEVICHSMGCRTVLGGLELLAELSAANPGVQPAPLKELIIASPDVDAVVFRRALERLSTAGYGMTLYASDKDKALEASKGVAGGYPRAGDLMAGEPVVVPSLQSIDVSELGDSFDLQHSEYADEPVLMQDVAKLLLRGTRPPTERTRFFRVQTKDGKEFWRY